MRLKQQILTVSAAYCAATGLSEATVSTRIYGGGKRIPALREGKGMVSDNIEDGLQWFSDRWPEGAVWPSEVMRPAPAPPAATTLSPDAAPSG